MHQLSRVTTPEQAFDALLRTEPSRPFVTYYDEASGERAELSVKSLANWVAKTHSLLVDELALGVGDEALLSLPPHWISVPAVIGCWTAGLAIAESASAAAVAFVEPASLAGATGVPDVYAIAPDTAAVGFRGAPPDGAQDYVTAVRPQPDAWPGVQLTAAADDPFWAGRTRGDAVAWARERATELGVADGARVLSTRGWHTVPDLLDALLVPLVVGGSLVLVRNADDAVVERRVAQERATVRL